MKEISNDKYLNKGTIVIFIAVLCSSMTGAQFFGISLNKIALIPLECLLLSNFKTKIYLNKLQRLMMIWYFLTIISCLFALTINTTFNGFVNKIILNIIQILLIYIPILVFVNTLYNPIEKFKYAIIKVAKINTLWAIIQFVCWYSFKIDFNDYIFNELLKGLLGTNWTAWNYEAGTLAIRITGLNSDSAFFAVILVLGFCLVDKKIWKFIFLLACILSMSRAGIITICIIQIIIMFNSIERKINPIKLIISSFTIIGFICVFIYMYIKIPSVQYQINYTIQRFSSVSSKSDVGTTRHLLYIPLAFRVWFWDFSIITKLFGVGPRVGGVALVLSNTTKTSISFSNNMFSSAWAVECDIAEILLGHGIFGFLLYYILWKLLINCEYKYRFCIISLLVMGIMYNILEITLIQLFIICLLPVSSKKYNIMKSEIVTNKVIDIVA